MELRDLRYFAAIAEHRSVRRAAEELNLSQPGLSKSLRRLEQEMRTKLVSRTPKGVELTAVGSILAAHVNRLQLGFEDVAREAADLSDGKAGHLRVGAGPACADLLPVGYATLQKEAPGVTFSATVSDSDVMIPALLKGDLDIVVNYFLDAPLDHCDVDPLPGEYDVVVYSAATHPLVRKKSRTLDDLAGQGWVLSPINVTLWHPLTQAFQKNGLPSPRVAFAARSVSLRLQAVSETRLLGFLAGRVVRQAASQYRLKELPIKNVVWHRPIGIIRRKGAYLSPVAQRFIEILKSTAKGG